MALEGCPIATNGWAGERSLWSECRNVSEGGAGQPEETVKVEANSMGESLNLAEQTNNVVCRNTRSSVVGRTVIVSHINDTPTQGFGEFSSDRVTSNGKGCSTQEAICADLSVWEWKEGVNGTPARVLCQ